MSKELLTIEELTDKVLGKIRECKEGNGVSEVSMRLRAATVPTETGESPSSERGGTN
jgi:hypothetical protein